MISLGMRACHPQNKCHLHVGYNGGATELPAVDASLQAEACYWSSPSAPLVLRRGAMLLSNVYSSASICCDAALCELPSVPA